MNACLHRSLRVLALMLGAAFAEVFVSAAVAGDAPALAVIKELDVVHFAHTDVGFTDNPMVCRELFRRYVGVAVDTVLDSLEGPKGREFFWTAEATRIINDLFRP